MAKHGIMIQPNFKLQNIQEIIIIDGHNVLYCGKLDTLCSSMDNSIQSLRAFLVERKISDKVYYNDKLFVFLNDGNFDDNPIAHLILGGNRDA